MYRQTYGRLVSDLLIEHRRRDGELIGWMRIEGDDFVPVDLLGRDRAQPCAWDVAEALLDELGLRYLAEPFALHGAGAPRRARPSATLVGWT